MRAYTVTDREVFKLGAEVIVVETSDTAKAFAWRMIVGENAAPWTRGDLQEHMGWVYARPYYEGLLPISVPFKPLIAQKV